MVCQSQSPIFHRDVMLRSWERIGTLFPHVRMYTAVVPTYPGGLWSFTLGSKRPLPAPEEIRFDKEAFYVNENVLRASFALPAFLEKLIREHGGQ
jgi:spermidine synthase